MTLELQCNMLLLQEMLFTLAMNLLFCDGYYELNNMSDFGNTKISTAIRHFAFVSNSERVDCKGFEPDILDHFRL